MHAHQSCDVCVVSYLLIAVLETDGDVFIAGVDATHQPITTTTLSRSPLATQLADTLQSCSNVSTHVSTDCRRGADVSPTHTFA